MVVVVAPALPAEGPWPDDCAERMDWPIGPLPMTVPPTIDSAAAATAADAMNGLRAK